jgi:hypothetical protein
MDLITQQWISRRVWRSAICWGKWLHKGSDPLPDEVGDSTYLSWYVIVKVPGVLRVAEIGTKWCRVTVNIRPINPTKESMCLPNYVKRNLGCLHQHDVTLITSTPSKVRVAPDGVKALRLACTIIEFGRTTELEVCEPKRSSGSQSSCCIRSTASCDTRGNEGKRKDCFQFRIFCRVRWRYEADTRGQNYIQNARGFSQNC